MITHKEEFVPHTAPLIEDTEQISSGFKTLINCDINDMELILSEYEESADNMYHWIVNNYSDKNTKKDEQEEELVFNSVNKEDNEQTSEENIETPKELPAEKEKEISDPSEPEEKPDSGIKNKIDTMKEETQKAKDVFLSLNEEDDMFAFAQKDRKNTEKKQNNNKNNSGNNKKPVKRQNRPKNNKPKKNG